MGFLIGPQGKVVWLPPPVAPGRFLQASWMIPHLGFVRFSSSFAFQTAGDAGQALPFGLTMDGLERWALVYLGLSSLVFVAVWLVGYLRR